MHLLKKVTLILLLLVVGSAKAQKFELGKVSIAELEEKAHPADPSASAAVLFEKGEVYFEYSENSGFDMFLVVKSRIKIYKKEGYEWANKQIRYYAMGNGKETVSIEDAATFNLVGGKIEKTKLKSDGEFDNKINKYWSEKKLAFPNVKEGSIIEYSYKIKSPNYARMREWQFQTSIPVNHSEFVTRVPEYFVFSQNQRGSIFPKTVVEKSQKSINFTSKERSPGRNTTYSFDKVMYEETKTTYTAKDLPAMKEEAYVNNINNYTASISHELSMTRFPNAPFKNYSTNWDAVVKEIYNYDDFGPELGKTGYFEEAITNLTKGMSNDEMIPVIHNFVQTNIKWDGYYGYSCNDGVKAAYKNKTGNVAEINLMLTAMLRYAGLNANPVLVSTRSNGIAYFPNRTAYNYVIAAVETPDGLVLLDATDKFALPNILPTRDLNWFGRLIRKDGTSMEVNLTPKRMSREINYLSAVIQPDGSAEGKIRRQYTDYEALEYRAKAVGANKESFIESIENENHAIEISDYTRENDLVLNKPLLESFSFKDVKTSENINGKLYVSPLLFLTATENPFKQEKREYPIDYGYPTEVKYTVSLELPQGYTVESLPKPINLVTGDDIGSFKYSIANVENKIQLSVSATINFAIVSAEYYEVLKDFYQKMIEKESEKIVLAKS